MHVNVNWLSLNYSVMYHIEIDKFNLGSNQTLTEIIDRALEQYEASFLVDLVKFVRIEFPNDIFEPLTSL